MSINEKLDLTEEEVRKIEERVEAAADNQAVTQVSHWILPNSEAEFDDEAYIDNYLQGADEFEEALSAVLKADPKVDQA